MDTEIERKFLLKERGWKSNISNSRTIKQAFFDVPNLGAIRVRINEYADSQQALIQMKNRISEISCLESTMEIPLNIGQYYMTLNPNHIAKRRFDVPYMDFGKDNLNWEIDIFHGLNQGLELVEIELPREDYELIIPNWVGEEVTGKEKYYNYFLYKNPYTTWDAVA